LFAELILVDGIDVALLNSKLGTANLTFELSLPHSVQKHLKLVLHQLTNRRTMIHIKLIKIYENLFVLILYPNYVKKYLKLIS